MKIEEIKSKYGEFLIVALLLFFAIIARFIAISQQISLDWSEYSKVLDVFFRTLSRSQIFLVQFAGVLCYAAVLPFNPKKEINAFKYAGILFMLVSILRYIYPTFIVSILGDLLVLVTIVIIASSFRSPKIASALFILAVFVFVPRGFWVMGFAMLVS